MECAIVQNLAAPKVSKIVAQNYKTGQVFTAHGIDFCCNGGIPLEQACEQQNVDVQVVTDQINRALATPETENFAAMPLDELVRHIEKVHHHYVKYHSCTDDIPDKTLSSTRRAASRTI
jgi:regulator of cell morphogenesis and NO signaling